MNEFVFPEAIVSRIYRSGIMAVIVVDAIENAVPLARALIDGGIDCMELTLRTEIAFDAMNRIQSEVPEMLVGVGTVLTLEQVNAAKKAGAAFGVAPGMNPRVVAEARRIDLPFAPGVCTPTDIELAIEQGCRLLKFFPSEPSGGLPYLRSIAAPFMHLGVKFIPLGGMDLKSAEPYAKESFIHAIGGSWLAPRELIQRRDWDGVRENARQASALIQQVRQGAA